MIYRVKELSGHSI